MDVIIILIISISCLASCSSLIITLVSQRRKQVDIAEQRAQIFFLLLESLKNDTADLEKKIKETP